MKDIRRFYPNRRILSGILRQPENVGCIFGIISKSGATAKTRTFTTLKVKQHKLTGKVSLELRLLFARARMGEQWRVGKAGEG
jgi:hypothetical protein